MADDIQHLVLDEVVECKVTLDHAMREAVMHRRTFVSNGALEMFDLTSFREGTLDRFIAGARYRLLMSLVPVEPEEP